MKKILLCMLIMISFISCDKNEAIKEVKKPIEKEVNHSELANRLAVILNQAIMKDNSVLDAIQTETKKKFDGDYDILIANTLNKNTLNNSDKRQKTRSHSNLFEIIKSTLNKKNTNRHKTTQQFINNNELDILIDEVIKNEPLMNIYMPDWGNINEYDDFLIVLAPTNNVSTNKKEEFALKAFNKKGEILMVSSLTEPDLPYLVIGTNERVGINNTYKTRPMFSTKYHDYYFYSGIINKTSNLRNVTKSKNMSSAAKSKKRDLSNSDWNEVITRASFNTRSLLQDVEYWYQGEPDVYCKVYYKKFGAAISSFFGAKYCIDINMDNRGWCKGRRFWGGPRIIDNYGNWNVFCWNREALITAPLIYQFLEKDGDFNLSVSFGQSVANVTVTSGGDNLGQERVYYNDPLGKTYRTSHINFTIDRKKRYE